MNRLFKVETKIIPEVEEKKFIIKLESVGFTRVNAKSLTVYMDKAGVGGAINHIKGNYIEYVIEKGWSERKFADITFLIAREKRAFSQKNYSAYEKNYDNGRLRDEVLNERLKYQRQSRQS